MTLAEALANGELRPVGRLAAASNVTLLCEVDVGSRVERCVYKPVSGERPLWDFPDTALAAREVLTAQVAAALGWHLLPTTVWRTDGPLGPGMCQEWVTDTGPGLVRVLDPAMLPAGWRTVAEGQGAHGEPVVVAHAAEPDLRRLALLDVLLNNADRKGGHVLRRADGRLAAIDHGLTFHAEPKLRTVLWGWAGEPIPVDLLTVVSERREACEGLLEDESLGAHLTAAERTAFADRVDVVLSTGTFPVPGSGWPALPWPLI